MKENNFKKWWKLRKGWEKIISVILVLNVLFSIIFTLISDLGNISNLIFSFTLILAILIVSGLLFWRYTKNPKLYGRLGIIIATIYFTILTLAFYYAVKPQGEYNAFMVPLFFPFGFWFLNFLPRSLSSLGHSLFWDWIAIVLNFVVVILVGTWIDYKPKKKK